MRDRAAGAAGARAISDSAVEVYLVRHAAAHVADSQRFQDTGLTPAGMNQARTLAKALREVDFAACVSSPLRRAVETAQLLIEGRELPLRLHPDLSEGDPGDLVGLSEAEASARYPDDFRLGPSVVARVAAMGRTAPGGESRMAFLERAGVAAHTILRELKERESSLLVVAHGGLLNYLMQILLRMPARDEVPFGFDHCGVARLLYYREGAGFGPFPMLRFGPP